MSIKKIAGQVKLWNTLGGTAPDGYNNIEFSEIALKADNTKQSLLDTLGIPGPYDDDTAAATGGVAVGGLYYVTTTLVLQARVA